MQNIKLIVEYDGTDFAGFQVQPKLKTIAGELQKAAKKFLNEQVKIIGSGRTDAGVHAMGQVCNFETSSSLPMHKIVGGFNNFLPSQIAVLDAEVVDSNFHSQYNSKKKTYVYKVYYSKINRPLMLNRFARVYQEVNVQHMIEAAKLLVGKHDFKSFTSSECVSENTVREIYSLEIKQDGHQIEFKICGNGFLHNMVRIIVGTLLSVGQGKIDKNQMQTILQSKDRTLNKSKTAPACGLYLESVKY